MSSNNTPTLADGFYWFKGTCLDKIEDPPIRAEYIIQVSEPVKVLGSTVYRFGDDLGMGGLSRNRWTGSWIPLNEEKLHTSLTKDSPAL